MKFRKNKKGFTIVELIIVIAVIGILTAVMVPTIVHLVNKANKASDDALVSNLNKAIQLRRAEPGVKAPVTMHETVVGLEEYGYKLDALVAKSDQDLIYDLKADKFLLANEVDADKKQAGHYWKIQNDATNNGYNIYASSKFSGDAENLTVGFDAGEQKNISKVGYIGTKNIIIRTNSYTTDLYVNTDNNVEHFGNVGKVNIEKVAMNSFYENGNARAVMIKKGNLVVESTGNVTLVSVTAVEEGDVKLNIQGDVELLAGDETKYEITAGEPEEKVEAAITNDTVAIVDGESKTSLEVSDFANAEKVVLLEDFVKEGLNLDHDIEIVGNMTKLDAQVSGSGTIVLKNIHTTNIHGSSVSGKTYKYNGINFNGSLTFDGGYLEYGSTSTSNYEEAAIYINNGYGTYSFKNMMVSANTNKGIKISKAASVTIENCEFDASRLTAEATSDQSGSHARSLSAIDIQEQNTIENGKMVVSITGNYFKDIPQGDEKFGVADADTSAAIKIKTEEQGFETVTVSSNKFEGCYRDLGVGVALRQFEDTQKFLSGKNPEAMRNNAIGDNWTVKNNTTSTSESIVSQRGYLTYELYNTSSGGHIVSALAEKVGYLLGGCAVFETARSIHAND